jgi:hypothetical protein
MSWLRDMYMKEENKWALFIAATIATGILLFMPILKAWIEFMWQVWT